MPLETWLAFVAASTVLLIIPGPTILTVISYSVAHGRRVSLPLVAAVALGDSTALLASLVGLGALLAVSTLWFTVVKVLGGLYLLYLGIKLLLASSSKLEITSASELPAGWKLFSNTYLVTALNPKGIVFFAAFLPQFVSPNANSTHQLFVLAGTFVALATLNTALYIVFAARVRKLLTSVRAQRRFNLAGGSLLSIAGIWALFTRSSA